MKSTIFIQYVVPFFQWFFLLILCAIATDYFLHRNNIEYIGYYLGYFGTFLILISFVYSLRKRKIINTGSPKSLLTIHEYLSWFGAVLILIHAGIHFNALLPWLAIFMLLITVASGLIGKFILKKANETYKIKLAELIKNGTSKEIADQQLFFDSICVHMMKKWKSVHIPITILLGVLSIMHIVSVIMLIK